MFVSNSNVQFFFRIESERGEAALASLAPPSPPEGDHTFRETEEEELKGGGERQSRDLRSCVEEPIMTRIGGRGGGEEEGGKQINDLNKQSGEPRGVIDVEREREEQEIMV